MLRRKAITRAMLSVSLLAGGSSVVLVTAATPSAANSFEKSCNGSGLLLGENRLVYYSYNSTIWHVDEVYYKFGPSASGSDNNNQNMYLWNGNYGTTFNSADNLRRDGNWRYNRSIEWSAVKNNSWVTFTDIFDTSGDDPRCTRTRRYF